MDADCHPPPGLQGLCSRADPLHLQGGQGGSWPLRNCWPPRGSRPARGRWTDGTCWTKGAEGRPRQLRDLWQERTKRRNGSGRLCRDPRNSCECFCLETFNDLHFFRVFQDHLVSLALQDSLAAMELMVVMEKWVLRAPRDPRDLLGHRDSKAPKENLVREA